MISIKRARTSLGFARLRAQAALLDAVDGARRAQAARKTGLPVPPRPLRERVSGANDLASFLDVGRQSRADIEKALADAGADLRSCRRILDFGCGSGRTLRWFGDLAPPASIFGTDTDAEAIEWCRANLRFARFSVNDALPPLEFPDDHFDLIYAISVFTHIDENFQFQWLRELRRVAAPGAFVLVTLHGPSVATAEVFTPEELREYREKGFYFRADASAGHPAFAEWYRLSAHTPEYVRDRYAEFFDVLEYVPRGLNNHQDLVVLRKPSREVLAAESGGG